MLLFLPRSFKHLVLLYFNWEDQTTFELVLVPRPSALCAISLQFAHLEIF